MREYNPLQSIQVSDYIGGVVEEGEYVGTFLWGAPELFLQRPRPYSKHSDAFALALVVYECLWRVDLLDVPITMQCIDFAEFTSKGGRPSLDNSEWASGICTAVEAAWHQDPNPIFKPNPI